MSLYKRGKIYWYKFMWNGESSAPLHKAGESKDGTADGGRPQDSLAKGEVGIRERKTVPTLREFARGKFADHVASTFGAKVKTPALLRNGIRALLEFESLAGARIDGITTDRITAYAGKRQRDGLAVSSINRELQVLRRMFTLAQEWTVVDKVLPKVRMLPGERHRDRVISDDEEAAYLNAAPGLLRQVATVLVDTAMRPEECFRMRWEDLQDDAVMVQHGKTESARRRFP